LVPLDGSAHAFKALDLASEIAVKYDATLLLLHAIPDEVELSEPQRRFARAEHIEGSLDQMQFTLAEQQLMTSARHRALQTGVRQVDTLVEPGDPAKVIIDHATDVDMIVMGRRGLGPIEGLLQGYCRAACHKRSTSSPTPPALRSSRLEVRTGTGRPAEIAVPPVTTGRKRRITMFKTIVVATDGSDHAGKAVRIASDMAEKYDARLVLCHVLMHGSLSVDLRRMLEVEHLIEQPRLRSAAGGGGVPDAVGMFAPTQVSSETLQGAIGAMGQLVIDAGTKIAHEVGVAKIDSVVTNGDAAEEILRCADRAKADLIVIGSRGLGDLKGLLMGSVSHKVNQLATCTCITVK